MILDDKVLISLQNRVKSIFDKTLLLEKKMELLKQARDRLLPKLMSGEIEV